MEGRTRGIGAEQFDKFLGIDSYWPAGIQLQAVPLNDQAAGFLVVQSFLQAGDGVTKVAERRGVEKIRPKQICQILAAVLPVWLNRQVRQQCPDFVGSEVYDRFFG